MDTGALPMDLEEDMMVTALHSRTLQRVVIHSLSSVLRDYSGYQRDGYQQNFKRGSGQSGPRGAPRGRGGPPRPNRGMPQMNTQQVN